MLSYEEQIRKNFFVKHKSQINVLQTNSLKEPPFVFKKTRELFWRSLISLFKKPNIGIALGHVILSYRLENPIGKNGQLLFVDKTSLEDLETMSTRGQVGTIYGTGRVN